MNKVLREKLDPYIKLSPFLGIGLVVVLVAAVAIYYSNKGAHLELLGSILKVRTLPIEDNSSAAIIDFRFRNPSDYMFKVESVQVTMTDAKGNAIDGSVISDVDSNSLFAYYPALGQKFNPSLIPRTKIQGRETMDRMLAVRFEVPEKVIQQRKGLRIHVVEVGGPQADIVEGQK
jgi:hypothetical protein